MHGQLGAGWDFGLASCDDVPVVVLFTHDVDHTLSGPLPSKVECIVSHCIARSSSM